MTAPGTGSCADWITWDDLPCDVDLSVLPGDEATWQALILSSVTNILWERSCRQFGPCQVTVRPVTCCRHRVGGNYYRSAGYCSCGLYTYALLGREPIATVDEVKINGAVLAADNYRVDEYDRLVRTDGSIWPACQDLALDPTEPGTWSVKFTYGLAVPPEAKLVAGLLACKWARELAESCAPPSNATSVAREGVTIQLAPPKPGESFGNTIVDAWVSQFHCSGRIFDPAFVRDYVRADT